MKSRQEIKALAKQAFAEQRATSIVILLIITLIAAAVGSLSGGLATFRMLSELDDITSSLSRGSFMDFNTLRVLTSSFGGSSALGSLFSIAVSVLTCVLTVNIAGAFINIFNRKMVSIGDPFSALSVNFLRKLGGMLWMDLWLILWTMLFVIPGIIKYYSYYLTPYILADCPNVTATEALNISKRMTKGHKGKLFVLDLSFIGWYILSAMTVGILYILYVGPYQSTTDAGFYIELRDKAIASGAIDPAELGMSMSTH